MKITTYEEYKEFLDIWLGKKKSKAEPSKEPFAPQCYHQYKKYTGFIHKYYYCELCGHKDYEMLWGD